MQMRFTMTGLTLPCEPMFAKDNSIARESARRWLILGEDLPKYTCTSANQVCITASLHSLYCARTVHM